MLIVTMVKFIMGKLIMVQLVIVLHVECEW